VKFVVYIDREGSGWPPPERPPGEHGTAEVTRETPFGVAVAEALRDARADSDGLYYFEGKGPYYSPRLLRDASDPDSGLVAFPRVAITSYRQLLWTWGARDVATFADYERSRDAGFFEGDPYGVFLERPMYGDGIIPGWEELVLWLQEGAVVGAVGWLISFLRKHGARYEKRGAVAPSAFLDIIWLRDEWELSDLCALFELDEEEASKLLESQGYEPRDAVGRHHWRVSTDPEATALRRRIRHDFLHYADEDQTGGE
jgi:hypothetical protein